MFVNFLRLDWLMEDLYSAALYLLDFETFSIFFPFFFFGLVLEILKFSA